MIKSAGYDAQQQMLEIEFANNGQIWQFDNVPEDICCLLYTSDAADEL